MTQLGASPYTALDQIPIGRRIREIMAEKGNYYSLAAMSKRLGTNRETFRSMLNGQREIYSYELEKISRDLKVSIERITQLDCKAEGMRLISLLDKQSFPEEAVETATQLLRSSNGMTERGFALLRLGRAYYFNKSYEQAYDSLMDGYTLAVQIEQEYGDKDLYYHVLNIRMHVCTALGNYLDASKALTELESLYLDNPTRRAAICYQHAKIRERANDLMSARSFAYESIEHALLTNKQALMGKTKVNAAHYEYLSGNYGQAKELLEQAVNELAEDVGSQRIAMKELIKTLLKLSLNERADFLARSALSSLGDQGTGSDIGGKFFVLRSRAQNVPDFAELVFENKEYAPNIRYIACSFLMQHYRAKGDSKKFIYYYEMGEELSPISSDILDEGGL